MAELYDLFSGTGGLMYLMRVIVTVIIIVAIFKFIMLFFKRKLLSKAKTKEQISNIKILSRIINIIVMGLIILIAFLSYLRSWTGIGVAMGLITAALGLSLQKPITGIAAWLIVVLKRPFNVGDRITLGKFKGDVYDISLTHLYLDEVGGLTEGEHFSGRNIMIPNHLLFEEPIINHTLRDDYVINEIEFWITYESNAEKAIKIAEDCTKKYLEGHVKKERMQPRALIKFQENKILIKISHYANIRELQQTRSKITREIFKKISKERDIKFAGPL